MRVLVTGSEGFLGKHVSNALVGDGHDVQLLDIVHGTDITKPLSAEDYGSLDAIIHMAAIAAPRTCTAEPTLAYDVNVNGTHQVLKLALETEARKFVFISSAHVYGISSRYFPADENHPLHPQETYTTTKILGEHLCELYYANYGLNYTTLRLFNAYGPSQPLGYFVPDILDKSKKGGFNLEGSNTTKDWVYVDDVVDAVLKAVVTDFVGPVNIGTGVETELGTIAAIMADRYQSDLIRFPIDNPTRMQCDWGRARRILGWSPKVSLLDGINRVMGAVPEVA